jgi:uncharacterized protein (TIGR02117 family)
VRRWLTLLAAALLLPPLAYLLLALLLGSISVNRDFQPTPPADGGVTVWLRTNGVHAELVLPAAAPHDWSVELPPAEVVAAGRLAVPPPLDWIAFGWGDRAFFMQTPTWADLRADTVLSALFGRGPAAMHVEYVARPQDYESVRIEMSAAQYARLVEALRDGFARGDGGRPIRIEAPGYFDTDRFYEGTGHYSARLTCNEWIRRVLAATGVRTAAWAPFDWPLFWHLRKVAP